MRNPVKNALYALRHNRKHLVYALVHRFSWLIPDDKTYLKLYYKVSMGKTLDLEYPTTFNAKQQWLKLYHRRDIFTTMADKVLVKDYVSGIIGPKYVIPTLKTWKKPSDINFDDLPDQFVLKTNNDGGSNGVVICKDKNHFDRRKALKELRHSFYFRNPYLKAREWPYKNIKKCVFAEQYVEDTQSKGLWDYKFYCFSGQPKIMLVVAGRNTKDGATFDYYDEDFNHLDFHQEHPASKVPQAKPACFEEMKHLAGILSEDIPFVRVDFYQVDGHPYFGEFTFYDSGGTGPFHPEYWDDILGSWITLPPKDK
jgi:hypothetical protein